MKHPALLVLSFVCLLPLQATNANGAGAIKHSLQDVFKAKDKDSDGYLSLEEFTDAAKDSAKAASEFTKRDTNGDGKLSLAEFMANDGKDEAQLEAEKQARAAQKAKAQADERARAQVRIRLEQKSKAEQKAKAGQKAKAEQKAKADAKAKADKWNKKS